MGVEIELRDVEAFVAVVDAGSFTSAARQLGINQSVVSTRVAHLESLLGIRLVDRGARRSTPTPAGTAALARARALLGHADELAREARRLGDLPTGTLELAASTVPGTFYLPGVLAELRRQAPGLAVDLRMSDSSGALRALRAGEVEFAVVGQGVRGQDLDAEPVWNDSIVLVARRELAADARTPDSLGSIPLVLRRPGSATRKAVVEALARRGLAENQLDVVLVAPDNEVARQAALAGLGAAFLPERAVERDVKSGYLTRLDRLFPPVHRPLELVIRRNRTLSTGARLALELLRNHSH